VPGVSDEPAPSALVAELGVSTVDVVVRFWSGSRQRQSLEVLHDAITATKAALDAAAIEMPAEIVVLQAAPSLEAAIQGRGGVTPGGGVRRR
jgi:small-conductance mechanosensitive channel